MIDPGNKHPNHAEPAPQHSRSLLGLDEEQAFFSKLGLFLGTLLAGPLLGLMLWLGIHMNHWGPVWVAVGEFILETLAVFWLSVLVFIWWRPSWFRRIYVSVERKTLFILKSAMVLGVAVMLLIAFVAWLMNW